MSKACDGILSIHADLSLTPGGPSPRAAHTCDVVGNFLVIFGGWSGESALGDSYAYHVKKRRWYALNMLIDDTIPSGSSSKKRQKFTASSLARNNHVSSVYRSELFIHGGHDGMQWLSNMFAVDMSHLENLVNGADYGKQIDVPVRYVEPHGHAPTKRACHSMTRAGDNFYTFGGYDGSQCFNDLAMFDPSTGNWTKLSKPHGKKPAARNAHAMVSDGKILYLTGGHSGRLHFDDVHTYTIATHTWTKVKFDGFVPPAVHGHSACHYRGYVYVFGGYNGKEPFNTLFLYSTKHCLWNSASLSLDGVPIARRQRSSICAVGSELYIFGGFNGTHWMNDMYLLRRKSEGSSISDDALLALTDNIGRFIAEPLFSDVTISVTGKSIPAHRVLLAASSSYFRDLLSEEDPPSVIELCGWSLDAVMKVIEYIYTSKIKEFNNHNHFRICEIMGLADSCRLDSLKALCEESLVEKLDIENTCYLLKYSKLYNAENLRQHCFDFICEHAADVMRTPGFEELSTVPSLVLELAKLSVNK